MVPRISQARPEKTDRSRATNRDLLLGGILLLWMAGLVVQLYHLQIIDYGDLLARAQRQQQHMIEVAPQRGEIFDRQMNPLAMSLAVDSVFAVPSEIPDPKMVADLLAPVLGLDANDLLGRIHQLPFVLLGEKEDHPRRSKPRPRPQPEGNLLPAGEQAILPQRGFGSPHCGLRGVGRQGARGASSTAWIASSGAARDACFWRRTRVAGRFNRPSGRGSRVRTCPDPG